MIDCFLNYPVNFNICLAEIFCNVYFCKKYNLFAQTPLFTGVERPSERFWEILGGFG